MKLNPLKRHFVIQAAMETTAFYITHVVDKSVYKSQDKSNIVNPISTLFKLLHYLHSNSELKNEFLSFVGIVFV